MSDEHEKIALRSDDMQEILGTPPRWIVRWGTSVAAITLLILGLFTYFYQYPDTIKAPISISSSTPPVSVAAPQTGYLAEWRVAENSPVQKNDILLVLQQNAALADVLKIDTFTLDMVVSDPTDFIKSNKTASNLQLGELQAPYITFLQAFKDALQESTQNQKGQATLLPIKEQIGNTRTLLSIERRNSERAKAQHIVLVEELARKQFGNPEEYTTALVAIKEKEKERIQIFNRLKNYEEDIKRNNINLLKVSKEENNAPQLAILIESLANLRSHIEEWKKKYLLLAPSNGRVSFYSPSWSSKVNIKAGEELMAIIPELSQEKHIIGMMSLPIVGSGKVQADQQVIIKLDNFPAQEYGVIYGKVQSKAVLPNNQKNIMVQIILPDTLITSQNKVIPFQQQLQGGAEIVTANRRFITRIFDKFFR